jgi:hypothetical protein
MKYSSVLKPRTRLAPWVAPCLIAACALIVQPNTAHAQEGVTCGMVETPAGPQFWGACPNQNRQPAPQPLPDKFGAVAWSKSTLIFATAWRFDTEQAAKDFALRDCAKKGAKDCTLAVSVADYCVAVAISPAEKVIQIGGPIPSNSLAGDNAVLHCQRAGGRSCKVAIAFCADGVDRETRLPNSPAPFGRRLPMRLNLARNPSDRVP